MNLAPRTYRRIHAADFKPGHDALHVGPMFRAAARHELDIARVFPRLDARFEAWAHLAAPVPLRHMIAIADHGKNVQVLEPSQVRRKGNIRPAAFLTGKPTLLCAHL